MSIGALFKRLVGVSPVPTFPAEPNADPFGREKPQGSPPPTLFTAPSGREPAIVQRDEIIDAKTRIAGYRFAARFADRPEAPDPRATVAVLSESRLKSFAERRLALTPLAIEDWPNYDWRALIGPHTVFEIVAPRTATDTWLATAQEIRTAGAKIALSQIDPHRDAPLLGSFASYGALDFAAYPLSGFEKIVAGLHTAHPSLQLIVDSITSWPERRLVHALGVNFCLGEFTTLPDEEQQNEDISPSRLVLIEMLNLLRREADQSELVAVAKRDPAVAMQLVGMANSPVFGVGSAITSVDQAIVLLGREPLYRWLAIAIFRSGGGSARDATLLELALARGRFLELIGQNRLAKRECDELFLVGLLSLMDSLLGIPMAKLLARIKLSATLADVLLRSEGQWGRYLLLAIAVEKGRVVQVTNLAGLLQIPPGEIEAASIAALDWAMEAAHFAAG